MPAPYLTLTINQPRTELLRPGWELTRAAGDIKAVVMRLDSDGNNVYQEGALPAGLWREPHTGVIMLKPGTLQENFWEDSSHAGEVLGLSAFSFNNPLLEIGPQIHTQRSSSGADLIELLLADIIMAILESMASPMVWVMQTQNPFAINEGFSVWVHPAGLFVDRATDYMLIAFGGIFCLHLQMNGMANLWAYDGANWSIGASFSLAEGGVDHRHPFQLSVVPWGYSFLSVLFSQAPGASLTTWFPNAQPRGSLLFDLSTMGLPVEFDQTSNQWIKTQSAPLSVGLRKNNHQYGFAWARVRYNAAGCTLYTMPEEIGEPAPEAVPEVDLTGFDGQSLLGTAPASLDVAAILNEEDDLWDPATDHLLVPAIQFTPSSDGIYTPELWSVDYSLPSLTWTPGWTPIDVSSKMVSVEFNKTAASQCSTLEARIQRDDDYTNLMKLNGPIRLSAISFDGTEILPVFDGYIQQQEPTLDGQPGSRIVDGVLVVDKMPAKDMWDRLDRTALAYCRAFDGRMVSDVLTGLIERCGFTSDMIQVDAGSEWISQCEFEGWKQVNSFQMPTQDSKVGDVIRNIIALHGFDGRDPIRIRWDGSVWHIYSPPSYDPSSPPATFLFLASSQIPLNTAGGGSVPYSDVERWEKQYYRAFTTPEIVILRPEFNALKVVGATGEGDGEDALVVRIRDVAAIQDPTNIRFQGFHNEKVLGPNDGILAQTIQELQKVARVRFSNSAYMRYLMSVEGEWQPGIEPDTIFWVIGLDNTGARTSYGAWRIDSVHVAIEQDHSDATYDTRHTWRGAYSLSYVGAASDDSTPMFTTVLPS